MAGVIWLDSRAGAYSDSAGVGRCCLSCTLYRTSFLPGLLHNLSPTAKWLREWGWTGRARRREGWVLSTDLLLPSLLSSGYAMDGRVVPLVGTLGFSTQLGEDANLTSSKQWQWDRRQGTWPHWLNASLAAGKATMPPQQLHYDRDAQAAADADRVLLWSYKAARTERAHQQPGWSGVWSKRANTEKLPDNLRCAPLTPLAALLVLTFR